MLASTGRAAARPGVIDGLWGGGADVYDASNGNLLGHLANIARLPSGMTADGDRIYVSVLAQIIVYRVGQLVPTGRIDVKGTRAVTVLGAARGVLFVQDDAGLRGIDGNGIARWRIRGAVTGFALDHRRARFAFSGANHTVAWYDYGTGRPKLVRRVRVDGEPLRFGTATLLIR